MVHMAHDLFVTAMDPYPMLRAEHIVPSLLRVGEDETQQVRRMPILLAIFQLASMTFLHLQGFFWFTKILLKGDLRNKK
jgi:hypothetical protein